MDLLPFSITTRFFGPQMLMIKGTKSMVMLVRKHARVVASQGKLITMKRFKFLALMESLMSLVVPGKMLFIKSPLSEKFPP